MPEPPEIAGGDDLISPVAAEMMMGDVVAAPQELKGGDRHKHQAGRLEMGIGPVERGAVIGDMFQHVEQTDEVKAPPKVGVRHRSFHERRTGPFFGELACLRVGFEGPDPSEVAEHIQVPTGPRPDLEDIAAVAALRMAAKHLAQDLPPGR